MSSPGNRSAHFPAGRSARLGSLLVLLGCLTISLYAAESQAATEAKKDSGWNRTPATSIPEYSVSKGQPMPSLAPMLKHAVPAVVNIRTKGRVKVENPLMNSPFFNDPFFRRFFGEPQQQQQGQPQYRETQALGSGVIVDAKQGYILTNNHVIENADQITVTLNDGRNFKAKVIGKDPETDIAVLQIHAKNLTALPIADSNKLEVGDFVVAIGNPFGLQHTVTAGIVSALGRSGIGNPDSYQDYIQTDASINPGNSGGALVNLRGQLVGINSAILSRSGGNIGIGFAIPSDLARDVMHQIIKYGSVQRGRLGVIVQNLTPDLAKALGTKADHGVVITQVEPRSSAAKAGLKAQDVIVEVNGKTIANYRDLRNLIGLERVGDKLTIKVERDGSTKVFHTQVGKAPQTRASAASIQHLDKRLAGASFANLTSKEQQKLGFNHGVMVKDVQPGSPAMDAGLRQGDVIVSVNRQPVADVSDFEQQIRQANHGELLFNVRRNGGALFLLIK
ncbi:MAG TPA: DegQ family serine endoprotease [Gammaproteobacteria bacterium]|nr:DegQ family serine endoprotease [Gammaproteobacteria bacterium]